MLRLYLFGAPRLERDGQPIALRRTKALALLANLAVSGQPQERDTLLALLWPEFDESSARNNLRRELSLLRQSLGGELLQSAGQQLALHDALWLDVAQFRTHLIAARQLPPASDAWAAALADAAALAGDEFLAGFSLPESQPFDEWQFFQREELRQQLAQALSALSDWHAGRGAFDLALGYARRWLALDPLREAAQRELMRIYALSDQPAAALRQYEACARLLATELGVAPEAATQALAEAIKARRLEPLPRPAAPPLSAAQSSAQERAPPQSINNLPAPVSSFVGRQREIADLVRRLTDPDCRLLTLVGPGGIGKTQLALRAAQLVAEGWAGDEAVADGVLFVPLTAVSGDDAIVTALAAVARFSFYPLIAPRQQLLDYLRARRMLVLLDGFEHLRDTAGFVVELLAAAPHLRLLVTSREALNLKDEWFHPLDGLSFPESADADAPVAALARFDAVRCFELHARRFQSDFSLSREQRHVVRLCQLVAGTPLALELAAAWLKLLTVEQIVAALERDLGILSARSRDLPERHRSMRTVLEETWRLLADDEQHALADLSVFDGSFTVAAATAIALRASFADGAATLPVLAALAERSLLRAVGEGRFQLHTLLRQFAAEKLAADPARAQATRARHGRFFLAELAEQGTKMPGPMLQAAVAATAREADNVRAAWQWACEQRQIDLIDRSIHAYHYFLFHRSAFQEGRERFIQAVAALADPPGPADVPQYERVAARAYVRVGGFCHFLGDHAASADTLAAGLERARRHGLAYEIALARIFQGAAAGGHGDITLARTYLHEALTIGRSTGAAPIITSALNNLAALDGLYGDFAEGKRLAHESLTLSRKAGELDRTAYALVQLAWLCTCRGEYVEAEQGWGEALGLFERLGDRFGIALSTGGVGYVAWCIGGERLTEAQQHTRRSLELLRTLNHRLSIASRLGDLALIELDRRDYRQAEIYSHEGLALARQMNSTVYTAAHLAILGHCAAVAGAFAQGRVYLGEALRMTAESKLLPRLASTCFQIAFLAVREAAALAAGDPNRAERQADALALLTAIGEHRAAMHIYRVRAQALAVALRRELPPELTAAAMGRGRTLELESGGAALLSWPPPQKI